jgi:hypothetical protein
MTLDYSKVRDFPQLLNDYCGCRFIYGPGLITSSVEFLLYSIQGFELIFQYWPLSDSIVLMNEFQFHHPSAEFVMNWMVDVSFCPSWSARAEPPAPMLKHQVVEKRGCAAQLDSIQFVWYFLVFVRRAK